MSAADLDAAVLAVGGPAAGAGAVDQVRVGCGDAGCAALLEGDFASEFEGDPRGARLGQPLRKRLEELDAGAIRTSAAPGALPGVDAVGRSGERYSLRVLSSEKAVVGDRAAVRAIRRSRGEELPGAEDAPPGAGLDLTRIDGDVPAGDLWIVAWDLERLVSQASRRVERGSPGAGNALRERVARAVANSPIPLEDIATVALSVGLGSGGLDATPEQGIEARLRVRCQSEGAALLLSVAMEAAAARSPEAIGVSVVRVGPVVEAVGAIGAPELLSLLEGG